MGTAEDDRAELEQLRQALNENATIGHAQGILMAVYNVEPDEGRQILVRLSQITNTQIQTVAEQVVATTQGSPATTSFTAALRAAVLSVQ